MLSRPPFTPPARSPEIWFDAVLLIEAGVAFFRSSSYTLPVTSARQPLFAAYPTEAIAERCVDASLPSIGPRGAIPGFCSVAIGMYPSIVNHSPPALYRQAFVRAPPTMDARACPS